MIFIGIDPGVSGGIAWLDLHGHCRAIKMPKTDRDIFEALCSQGLRSETGRNFAILERVHSMPGQGVSSTFKFGTSYGGLRMALVAAGVAFEEASPGVWQREFGLVFPRSKGFTPVQKKNFHKAKAQELFPGIKFTHATADATLMAEYGRRKRT